MDGMRKPSITMVLTDEVLTAIDAIAETEKRSRSQVADIVLRAGLAVVPKPLVQQADTGERA